MKRSAKGVSDKPANAGRFSKCLIVDGYNIVARVKQSALSEVHNLDAARDELLDLLMEYSAFTGEHVILVFDAHRTDDAGSETLRGGVRIIYTYKNETADERIERLVYELRDVYREITVATSDIAEQQVAFGGGALRITSGELISRLLQAKSRIKGKVHGTHGGKRNTLSEHLRRDVADILEKWRRR